MHCVRVVQYFWCTLHFLIKILENHPIMTTKFPTRLTVSGKLQIGWEVGGLEGRQDGVQKLKREE